MNIVIPPGFVIIVGVLLILGGVWRALRLGRAALPEAGEGEEAELKLDRARRERRRHFIWGIIWVLLGTLVILSTVGVFRNLFQR